MRSLIRIHSSESGGIFQATTPAYWYQPIQDNQIVHGQELANWKVTEPKFIAECGLLFLEGGGTLGDECWTITKDNKWVFDTTGIREAEHNFRCFNTPRIGTRAFHRGSCLDLGSNWCSINYAHWLIDSLGRLAVCDDLITLLDTVDYIRLPIGGMHQCSTILNKSALISKKLITPSQPDTLLSFDVLIRPTLPGEAHHYHSSVPKVLKSYIHLEHQGSTKVFLRRRGRRSVKNQAEIEAELRKRGFEIIDPSVDQFGSWASAQIVVSSHSAGLADIVFCREGAYLLELISNSWQRRYFESLCRGGMINYSCIIGESGKLHEDQNADFSVDLEAVIRWVDHTIGHIR